MTAAAACRRVMLVDREEWEETEPLLKKLEAVGMIQETEVDGEQAWKLTERGKAWMRGEEAPAASEFAAHGVKEVPTGVLVFIYQRQVGDGCIDDGWKELAENGGGEVQDNATARGGNRCVK